MKKHIILDSIVISCLMIPTIGNCAYMIYLKNGGRIATPQYWEEHQEVKFCVSGGVVGIKKDMVKRIEKNTISGTNFYEPNGPWKNPYKTEQRAEKELSPQKQHPEQFDLKAYQGKMTKLKADLNRTLSRIRKATTDNDMAAKDKAMADNREISAEMWKLTEELKRKNNGMLPADWWEGVGKEEPAME